MSSDSLIDSIISNGLCVGCGLCASLTPAGSIRMQISDDGFIHPVVQIRLSKKNQDFIKDICPGIKVLHNQRDERYHTIWGPINDCLIGHALNRDIRYHGSSGGLISAVALHLIESGRVDFIAHIAASKKDPLRNTTQISKNRSDILKAAGARYSPSAPLQELHSLIDLNRPFAMIGKPCDIVALRNLSRSEPKIDKFIPYMLSFFCAGVPSEKGTYEILKYLQISRNDIISLRYRGKGWPGKFTVETQSGERKQMEYSESWGRILNKHLQFRCKICPDGTGEFADIVGGDAWYSDDGYPEFTEQEGRNIILTRTDNGQKLIEECIFTGVLHAEPLKITNISAMQPYQANRKRMVVARLFGARLFKSRLPKYRGLSLLNAALNAGFGRNVKNFAGAFRRALKNWHLKPGRVN